MYYIVLSCTALYCVILYCIVLYCIVLHCIVLYCIVPGVYVYTGPVFPRVHRTLSTWTDRRPGVGAPRHTEGH